jgi:hypothetical protein
VVGNVCFDRADIVAGSAYTHTEALPWATDEITHDAGMPVIQYDPPESITVPDVSSKVQFAPRAKVTSGQGSRQRLDPSKSTAIHGMTFN